MVFYGIKATTIGKLDINSTTCQHCAESGPQNVTVFGKYAHLYWIPFFPVGKEAVAECSRCKKTIPQKEFPEPLRSKYLDEKSSVKSPIWHWVGIAAIASLMTFIGVRDSLRKSDPRSEMLQTEISQLTQYPDEQTDSTAYILKQFFNDFANEELSPSEFEFRSTIIENKVLILAKIPSLSDVEPSSKEEIFEMVEAIVSSENSIKDMTKYIGVLGRSSIELAKTPTGMTRGNDKSEKALFEFYGTKK